VLLHAYQLALQAQEEQESGYSPLHSCWSALLEQMLTSGRTDALLRALDAALPSSALLTPHEAHQLVEHSRSPAQAGSVRSRVCDTGARCRPELVLKHSFGKLLKTYCWLYAEQTTQVSIKPVCFLAVQHSMTHLPHACTLCSLCCVHINAMWD